MKRFVKKALRIGHNTLNNHITLTVNILRDNHPKAIKSVDTFRNETTLVIVPSSLQSICKTLRFDPRLDYNLLVDIAAKDHYPNEPRFSLSYVLHALDKNARIRVLVNLGSETTEIDSVIDCWKSADWPEREAFDMMGIIFRGHPDMRRILMPSDWNGHPLRKDYPLGYEEVQFSFNWKEIDEKKNYPKE